MIGGKDKVSSTFLNSLPEILDSTEFKACADGKYLYLKMMISFFDRIETIVGK